MRPPRSPHGDQLTVAYGGPSLGCLWHLAGIQEGGPTLVGRTFAYRPLIGRAFRRYRPPAGVQLVREVWKERHVRQAPTPKSMTEYHTFSSVSAVLQTSLISPPVNSRR